ncbi:MAG: ABC transporter transmembrane domain-containing protein, partial [Hespellia sp.]|nr:ABC transporter transmembrane domain-containing protein [Hespellia sp.]
MNNKSKKKVSSGSIKRLTAYVMKYYKVHCIIVLLLIILSALANVMGTMFMRDLIDVYILPFINQKNPSFTALAHALLFMAGVYMAGTVATWGYNRIMINVSQGTILKLRNEIFSHMESLPVKYFDTHAHGDIMRVYTNDTDTLRQMISQSLPQTVSAVITVVS